MTKPLPKRDVVATPTRQGLPRLTAVEARALASIEDENLKKVIGELLISSRSSQENFQELEQWFPVQGADIAKATTGIPIKKHYYFERTNAGSFDRTSPGVEVEEVATGHWYVTLTEEEDFPPDLIGVTPTSGVSGSLKGAEVIVSTAGEFLGGNVFQVKTYRGDTGEAFNCSFFFFVAQVGAEGNSIIGPKGPAGPTHKTLYHGEGEPEEELGEADDFYIDTTIPAIYGPKTEAGWGEGTSLVGPAGADGAVGPAGAEGKEGPAGTAGKSNGFIYEFGVVEPSFGKARLTEGELIFSEFCREPGSTSLQVTEILRKWSGGYVLVQELEGEVFALKRITGQPVVSGGKVKIPVATVGIGGGGGIAGNCLVSHVSVGPSAWGLLTALPESPRYGDDCYYIADKTNGVIWHLVYDGEGTYPWKKIGGPPLVSQNSGDLEIATGGGTAYKTAGQPAITTPLKMVADFRYYCGGYNDVNEENTYGIGLFFGAVEKSETLGRGQALLKSALYDLLPKTEVPSGTSVNVRYRTLNSKKTNFHHLTLEIDPIRVG